MEVKIRDLRDKFLRMDDEYLNGYAKLCGIHATGVYVSMCRHANKEQTCFPSKKLIAEELAISERSVYNAINKLSEWNIIQVDSQGRKDDGSFKVRLYTLLDKKEWVEKPQARGADGTERQTPQARGADTRRHVVPNNQTHINQTHINQASPTGNASEVNLLIDLFKEINPTEYKKWFANKTQRAAADDLIKAYTFNEVKIVVERLPQTNTLEYFPTITTIVQLSQKWKQLESAVKKKLNSIEEKRLKTNIAFI